ncbi:hypothetical protein MYP14_06200 [Rhodococcus pyridinivorans]|nr:hypothetical protein [Rhodococcus pyridinivorans]UPK64940.1 hypothetical protein MYP14_06200 [Rhodococcus pyridinivorans]
MWIWIVVSRVDVHLSSRIARSVMDLRADLGYLAVVYPCQAGKAVEDQLDVVVHVAALFGAHVEVHFDTESLGAGTSDTTLLEVVIRHISLSCDHLRIAVCVNLSVAHCGPVPALRRGISGYDELDLYSLDGVGHDR